jgi:hypothetical protein
MAKHGGVSPLLPQAPINLQNDRNQYRSPSSSVNFSMMKVLGGLKQRIIWKWEQASVANSPENGG